MFRDVEPFAINWDEFYKKQSILGERKCLAFLRWIKSIHHNVVALFRIFNGLLLNALDRFTIKSRTTWILMRESMIIIKIQKFHHKKVLKQWPCSRRRLPSAHLVLSVRVMNGTHSHSKKCEQQYLIVLNRVQVAHGYRYVNRRREWTKWNVCRVQRAGSRKRKKSAVEKSALLCPQKSFCAVRRIKRPWLSDE